METNRDKRGDESASGMTEVIRNQKAVETLFIDMIKAAEQEILLIFPTANSFLREERLGIMRLLSYGAKECGIDIKILTPINDNVRKIVQGIVEETGKQSNKNFHIRAVDVTYEKTAVSTVTIII